jgi:hypothetical protein
MLIQGLGLAACGLLGLGLGLLHLLKFLLALLLLGLGASILEPVL